MCASFEISCFSISKNAVKKQNYLEPTLCRTALFDAPQRCKVVVKLIMDMKHLGHPSYASIDEETVQARAAMLPVDGIPQKP